MVTGHFFSKSGCWSLVARAHRLSVAVQWQADLTPLWNWLIARQPQGGNGWMSLDGNPPYQLTLVVNHPVAWEYYINSEPFCTPDSRCLHSWLRQWFSEKLGGMKSWGFRRFLPIMIVVFVTISETKESQISLSVSQSLFIAYTVTPELVFNHTTRYNMINMSCVSIFTMPVLSCLQHVKTKLMQLKKKTWLH